MRLKIRQIIKLMSLGFIGLALLSCSKGDSEPEYQKLLSFNGYTARQTTKANGSFVAGNELPSGQAFGVYAYNTGTSEDFDPSKVNAQEGAYPKFMTNVAVTYNGGGAANPDKYVYSPQRYWPNLKESNRLAFFAYYPHNGAGITPAGFADFAFTVQDTPAAQVDFMLSDVVANQMYGAAGSLHNSTDVVDLKFYHMLTQVRFMGKTTASSEVSVKIDELKVVDVKGTGVLNPNVSAASSTWPEESLSGNKTFEITLKDVNLTSEAAAIAEADQTLLMIPQPLDECKLSVKYTITSSSPAMAITQTAVLDLSTETISAWVRNQQIVYTLNIGLNLIEFSADVANWTDNTGVIIGVE